MKTLAELIDRDEPGIDLVREWVADADVEVELLPPSDGRDEALLQTQVTTRSPMGAIVYETGGVRIGGGWIRFLGSGHPSQPRTLPGWNEGRAHGFLLVADDAVGGFYALNGGAFGDDPGAVYYWPPDQLEWEPLGIGFSDFFCWCLSDATAELYDGYRWQGWQEEVRSLAGDRCYAFYPFLWTHEGSIETSDRREVPVAEAYGLKVDLLRQMAGD